MICPATMRACCDDICRGNGCLKYGASGEPVLTKCRECGELIPLDGSYHDVFQCECQFEHEREYDPNDPDG
jgi:hypothetical protein